MLKIVGIGPAGREYMSMEAMTAILGADTIVGYKTYVDLLADMLEGKEVIANGMTREEERCRQAIDLASAGHEVALISSGDAGVYGMAGLVYEILSQEPALRQAVEVQVVPGITASLAAAALLGAPLMNDFCQISLSDWLTPWETIEKRLRGAAMADFVICLYNPRSRHRPLHLHKALAIVGEYKGPETPVGLVKGAGRDQEEKKICTLADVDEDFVDMQTLVIIGNAKTFVDGDWMITPRGYQL